MRLTREFTKKIKNDVLTYTTRPTLPIPVKVKSVVIHSDTIQPEQPLNYTLTNHSIVLMKGTILPGKPIIFDPPFKAKRGSHEFQITVGPINGIPEITGQIELEYSLSIF